MKRQIFFAILIMAVCSVSVWAQKTATIITLESNIRESSSIDSEVLATVKKGAKVKVLSMEYVNGWYYISYGKIKGWIHGNNIQIAGVKTVAKKPKVNDEWIYYASSSDERYYYNPAKTTRTGSLVLLWTKAVSKKTLEKTGMVQFEIRCQSQQYRSLAGVEYYESGAISRSWNKSTAPFSTIIPETIIEGLYDTVCR